MMVWHQSSQLCLSLCLALLYFSLRFSVSIGQHNYVTLRYSLQWGDCHKMRGEWSETEIQSTRLLLKTFTAADAEEVFCCITPTLTRLMAWEPPATRDEFHLVWEAWLPSIRSGSDLIFVIRLASNGHFLGLVGLHHAQTPSPELGIWIREDCHGNGYGREAVAAATMWASSSLKPKNFTYPVAEENHASRQIAESLGGVVIHRRIERKYTSLIYRIPPS